MKPLLGEPRRNNTARPYTAVLVTPLGGNLSWEQDDWSPYGLESAVKRSRIVVEREKCRRTRRGATAAARATP